MKYLLRNIIVTAFISLLLAPASSLALEVGDEAPAFTAQSNQGEISLADYKGSKHIVLALYFAAFSPV